MINKARSSQVATSNWRLLRQWKIKNNILILQLVAIVLMCLALAERVPITTAQGIKGSSGNSFNSFGTSSSGSNLGGTSGQLSSSFIQMFNSLTPIQQQQFIRQMSSSNRRVFQQSFPQIANYNFNEEVSSSSGGASGALTGSSVAGGLIGATKSGSFKQASASASSVLSPAQQASFFKLQQSKQQSFVQPTIQPSSQFSFSRQVSQQIQQPTLIPQSNSESSFQLQKTVVNQIPQQQSYFNRVQQVSQVAQPIVLPSSESSFRRVQQFSSQPLPVETSSGFTQQFTQQQAIPIPVQQTGFNKFQQFSSSSAQPVSSGFNQQFSQSSSSNGFGGGAASGFGTFGQSLSGFGGNGASSDFSSSLQQEKVDQNGITVADNSFLPGASGSSSFESSSSSSGLGGLNSGNFAQNFQQTSSGFDSSDVQQKNLLQTDDLSGLTAASINNKWYIMRPVENPSALGLGQASSGTVRSLPITAASAKLLGGRVGSEKALASTAIVAGQPKKRQAASVEKKKKRQSSDSSEESSSSAEADGASGSAAPISTSSSLMEANEEEDGRRK